LLKTCLKPGFRTGYKQVFDKSTDKSQTIFTDGSRQGNHTATAVVLKSHIITKRLPNSVSVYTAELYAILLALNELSKQQRKHYLLSSDSLSSLNSIANKKFEHPITFLILLNYHNLFTHSFNIIFCWLPSHVGISGNENTDKSAKSALNSLGFQFFSCS